MDTARPETQLKEVMSKDVVTVSEHEPLRAIAEAMRDRGIGDVLVTCAGGDLYGIVA
jgi:CBS domain-containing protein